MEIESQTEEHSYISATHALQGQGYTLLVTRGVPDQIVIAIYRNDYYAIIVSIFDQAIITYARSYEILAKQIALYTSLLMLNTGG